MKPMGRLALFALQGRLALSGVAALPLPSMAQQPDSVAEEDARWQGERPDGGRRRGAMNRP